MRLVARRESVSTGDTIEKGVRYNRYNEIILEILPLFQKIFHNHHLYLFLQELKNLNLILFQFVQIESLVQRDLFIF